MSTSADGTKIAALSNEIDDIVQLAKSGLTLLLDPRAMPTATPVVLTCLATSTEKLLKLSLGLSRFDAHGEWPGVKTMQGYKHDIAELNQDLLAHLDQVAPTEVVSQMLQRSRQDETLKAILGALSRFAMGGRFHNLDTLASAEPPHPSPGELWSELENTLMERDPDILASLTGSTSEYRSALSRLYRAIHQSTLAWYDLLYRAWQHGTLGSDARRWSSQLGTLF